MSYIVPSRDIDLKDKKEFRASTQQTIIQRTLALGLARTRDELVIRDLFPSDLGMKDWSIPSMAVANPVRWINYQFSNMAVLGIYKVLQLGMNPTASTIKFKRSNFVTLAYFNLESCYAGLPIVKNLEKALLSPEAREVLNRMTGTEIPTSPTLGSPMEGYFTEPIVYDPQDIVNIEVEVKQPSDNYLVLGGFVCERLGVTVS